MLKLLFVFANNSFNNELQPCGCVNWLRHELPGDMFAKCSKIRKLLIASITTAKENA